jgi:prepilin-type N-terminal cleavage/methylation domain-containing protein
MIETQKEKRLNHKTNHYPNLVRGFTLVELLVVISLIAISAASFLPLNRTLQSKNDVVNVQDIIVQTLRRAQALSQAVDGDTTWGVHLQTGSVTLFQGPDYNGRNPAFDELFKISNSIQFSGVQDVVFTKLKGEPSNTGNTTLTLRDESKTININAKGIITY